MAPVQELAVTVGLHSSGPGTKLCLLAILFWPTTQAFPWRAAPTRPSEHHGHMVLPMPTPNLHKEPPANLEVWWLAKGKGYISLKV